MIMPDTKKWMTQEHAEPAQRGHLAEPAPWTEAQAVEMAKQDGLTLTDAHLGIIRYLRDGYADHGGAITARIMMNSLEEAFAGMGGHRFLNTLFPLGPIVQATHYAELPMPPGTRDSSFGITH